MFAKRGISLRESQSIQRDYLDILNFCSGFSNNIKEVHAVSSVVRKTPV